jgi:anthranilate synthase component 1
MTDITLEPNFEYFKDKYEKNISQIIGFKFSGDKKTITSSYLKTSLKGKNSFLFESLEDGDAKGRFSIIGVNPDLILKIKGNESTIEKDGIEISRKFDEVNKNIREFIESSQLDMPRNIPSVAAGVYGYIGYDFIRNVENLPDQNKDALGLPDCVLIRPSIVIVFDNISKEISIFSCSRPNEKKQTSKEAFKTIEKSIQEIFDTLNGDAIVKDNFGYQKTLDNPISNTTKEEYFDMVRKAKDYIVDGDIFQVVPSQRFSSPFKIQPFKLYESLRKINPSPYMYFLDLDDFCIVGSSPETLVQTENKKITIKPIAGTRLKQKNSDYDLESDLLSDPKERAEHLMLLDLGRNDVGRVSKIGSVKVIDPFSIQETSHLIHIVSTVEGELREGEDQLSALSAGFPAGTVSGAPKIRAMEIIDELEKEKRGIYAGAVGYFSANGDMDTAIALRTAIIKDRIMYVQAGGGVVYDSNEEYEYNETINKSQALFAAAKDAIKNNLKE